MFELAAGITILIITVIYGSLIWLCFKGEIKEN